MSSFLIHFIFYLFSATAIGSALIVISTRHPVHSVLSLVVSFFSMAGIWMLLRAEFLSLILLLVYVGAVMTLFLFVVMMLSVNKESKQKGFIRYWPFALCITLLTTGLIVFALIKIPTQLSLPTTLPVEQMRLSPNLTQPLPSETVTLKTGEVLDISREQLETNNIFSISQVLYTHFAYLFEMAGVILLTAIVAAISLTHRPPSKRKIQHPEKQIAVRPEDRIRLVKIPGPRK